MKVPEQVGRLVIFNGVLITAALVARFVLIPKTLIESDVHLFGRHRAPVGDPGEVRRRDGVRRLPFRRRRQESGELPPQSFVRGVSRSRRRPCRGSLIGDTDDRNVFDFPLETVRERIAAAAVDDDQRWPRSGTFDRDPRTVRRRNGRYRGLGRDRRTLRRFLYSGIRAPLSPIRFDRKGHFAAVTLNVYGASLRVGAQHQDASQRR